MQENKLISLAIALLYMSLFLMPISIAAGPRLPSFQDYCVSEKFVGMPAPVNLSSHPKAPRFRTRLRDGARKEPNFAGHYTVVEWGCGSGCLSLALVDAISGQVVFPDKISPVFFPGLPEGLKLMDQYDVLYRTESSLLIVHGVPATRKKVGSYYYNFNGSRFELVAAFEWESEFNR